uniref:Uncharacterized protein n=1 Tax=Oryza brachyantha TaxID=4533 RepID=J3N1M3_ORYBR
MASYTRMRSCAAVAIVLLLLQASQAAVSGESSSSSATEAKTLDMRKLLNITDGARQLLRGERGAVPEQRGAPPQRHPGLQRGDHQRVRGVHGVRRPRLLRRVRVDGARRPEPVPARRLQRLPRQARGGPRLPRQARRAPGAQRRRLLPVLQLLRLPARGRQFRMRVVRSFVKEDAVLIVRVCVSRPSRDRATVES